VVVDTHARLSEGSHLVRHASEIPTLVICGPDAGTEDLARSGVQVLRAPLAGDGIELPVALRVLAERGVHSVLCEGGAGLAGSLLDAGLVDEVAWFIAPKLAGGEGSRGAVGGRGVERMAEALRLDKIRHRRFGEDLGVFGYLRQSPDLPAPVSQHPTPDT
jgi:diaminohydroxyphosphoribosylaminopyrimidine deaminase/5-amino-6-(5-phosphoribosylamino)uracil reductase